MQQSVGESPVLLSVATAAPYIPPCNSDHPHPELHPPGKGAASSSPASAPMCGDGELPEFLFLSMTPCTISACKSGLNLTVGQLYAC